ncbi:MULTISPECIES: sigma-54 dependent transcriptional regulator [unclassified Variovorax]|uniref:sigma-54-dependent transcriptional regulator n=1 Tax=unclassified Variovorax TaxID=663243 RepID=UPI000837F404|nr:MULTISPECIES: sigma-54 dependent transcriptional regulator [unclassified Variovorax]PNG52943.1 C4-dicarboxylate transport transcriptional regulatory protein DctD [Variovorax sp. B2]PNG53515.1 C4-dicarboxylate transport transcriptional regulatory protein DctD [Variovorax sp. B4]VTV10935.1 C4-dicarboxylate transport transcriptional regulatory protein DctD [Variovorax sp. WDL1]
MTEPQALEVLFVEDDDAVRLGSTQALQLAGLRVSGFGSAEKVLAQVVPGLAAVLVTDVRLPGMDGLELLSHALKIEPTLPVILITGHGDISMAVHAMRLGAYDFLEKPFSPEQLTEVVQRALEKRALSLEVERLRSQLAGYDSIEARLIGRSPAMQQLRRLVRDLASSDADVLVLGETGTGKELVARCLHEGSRRRAGHFAAINCGGMPEALFESEMFGHEAGAFTGAAKRRIGKIEHARGGTLFLDEIETMPMSLQVKMLRTLQERQFERLGSNELRPMDSRVIAATKVDLLAAAREGKFRDDLYYRLGVVLLPMPPLRDRREDIPLLFTHFANQAALRHERELPPVHGRHLAALVSHAWPGNVRELRNIADRFVLGLWDGEARMHDVARAERSLEEQVAQFERYLINEALEACNGSAAAAAERLSLPRKTLYDKIRRLGSMKAVA